MDGQADTKGATANWSGGQIALSALVVSFTAILGLMCVFMLSCTLAQTRISSITLSGVNVSIWKLDDIRKQWQTLRGQINAQSSALAVAQEEKTLAGEKYSAYDLVYRPARTALDAKMGPLIARIATFNPDLAKTLIDEGPVERIERLESQNDDLIKAQPGLAGGTKEILTLGEEYKQIDATRIKLKSDNDTRTAIAASAAQNLEALRTSLDNLFSSQFGIKPIDAATRARIENALFELYSDDVFGRLTNSILVLPPDILTLFLVVLMGVLGSSLQLTHQLFVRQEADSLGVYSLRLCVGAITALVIFIIAKAGVPIVADTSRFGGDTPINPYFVSFLAIISGLMSENAISSVQVMAEKYFGAGDKETPRWALPMLQQAFENSKRPAAELAQRLDVSETTLRDWIAGKEPAPLAQQKVLAAVFNVSLREIFSDIAPDVPAGEAGGGRPEPAPAA
jgi:hypothetical protein